MNGDQPTPATDETSERPNQKWWQVFGGEPWRAEVERRRATQPRYDRQEAWLVNFFAQRPGVRVLDFGCGYGRHLKNLIAAIPLDLHGCDISPTQLERLPDYVGDQVWAREHVRRIEPLAPLPWEDASFDVTYSSEVLIHVAPADLPNVLGELLRVTLQTLVLIENKAASTPGLSAGDHGGCWLHDFRAAFEKLGQRDVRVLTDVLEDQDVYLINVSREGDSQLVRRLHRALADREATLARLRRAGVAEALEINKARQELEVSAELERARRDREEVEHLRAELKTAITARVESDLARREAATRAHVHEQLAQRLDSQVRMLEDSMARKLVQRAKRVEGAYRVARQLITVAQNIGSISVPRLIGSGGQSQAAVTPLQVHTLTLGSTIVDTERFLAARPRVIGVCHPHWRGIRAATQALCDASIQIEGIPNEETAQVVSGLIDDAQARVVVIQGVPPGSERLIRHLRSRLPRLRLLNVFHGAPALHTTAPDEAVVINNMLELARAGQLDGVGLVKEGFADVLKRLGYPVFPIFNKIAIGPRAETPPRKRAGHLDLGVFVPNIWHKNLHTQMLAALSIQGAMVHVCEQPPAPYFSRFSDRIRTHGMMKHAEFLRVLGEMDANLYVSLNECYPMTVLESLERGVICLTSHTSPIFDDSKYLFDRLVVTASDDPGAIAAKLRQALDDREELVKRGLAHIEHMNQRADELWGRFVAP